MITNLLGGKLAAVGAIVLAAAFAASVFWAYQSGKAADRQRSDLVIEQMKAKAAADLLEANARNAAISAAMQETKERAEREAQEERARNGRRLADALATDRLVRDEVRAFASGPGADQDSIAACRADARTAGDVLVDTLRAHALCSDRAEAEAGTARLLLRSWPTAPAARGAGSPAGAGSAPGDPPSAAPAASGAAR